MQCYQCGRPDMRLLRYQGSREIWACRNCGAETPLLDCHCCERRGVYLAAVRPGAENLWDCAFCGNRKRQCARCSKGWMTAAEGALPICSHCRQAGMQ